MKIEQAAVAMNCGHNYSSECEFKIESTVNFRQVFSGVSAAQNATADGAVDRQTQLLMLIDELIARLQALIAASSSPTERPDSAPTRSADAAESEVGTPSRRVELAWSTAYTETIREHESTDFSSTGKIVTADGRALDFSLDLSMCRDFSCERTKVESGKIVLRDPLVITFDGQSAALEGKSFAFDLDADGKSETIHELGGGSGYLAIDRNGDGRINDGSELFGARSGDGFADLAAFDGDGNRWLDEADAAYGTLRVWQRDATGQQSLVSLSERGVGALYLGSIATPFSLKDGDNRLLGQICASGIYLNEDGSAGSLQQIDLAV